MGRTMLLFIVLVALWLAAPAAAQDATPGAVPEPATLLSLSVDDLPPDGAVDVGIARTLLEPGTGLVQRTGSGATVVWVETGSVTLSALESTRPPRIHRAAVNGGRGTPEPAGSDDTGPLRAGDAAVLPSGSTTEIRNDGGEPATLLTLLGAPDATIESDSGVVASVIVGGERTWPSPSVTLVLDHRTLEPAERLALAPAPTVTFVAALVRTQNVKLGTAAGGFTNRDTIQMPIYVLTIEPVEKDG